MYLFIPTPCHENWDEMTPTEKGRFCAACQKQVIDFTTFSDTEIVTFLQKNPLACGRFYKKQLNKNYPVLPPVKAYSPVSKWTKRLLAAAMLLGINAPIFAQNPPSDISVKGNIRDNKTKQAVPFATAFLYEVQEDGSLVELNKMSTDQKANYDFSLEAGKDYKVVGNAEGYLANETKFSTQKLETEDSSEPIVLERNIDIKLEVIEKVMGFVTEYVFFEEQKYFLSEERKHDLDRLIELLKKNPNITIQLTAHCDVNEAGENTYRLSELRAMAAVKYCVEHGIEAERLSYTGFGDKSPIFTPAKTEEEKQVNRRLEFRITSIDYQKK